jgi:hypothetical protein
MAQARSPAGGHQAPSVPDGDAMTLIREAMR